MGPIRGLIALLLLMAAAARAETLVYVPPACPDPYRNDPAALLDCLAPVFVAPGVERAHNRIGSPVVERARRLGLFSRERVRIDPARPAIFGELRADRIGSRDVVHLVYRVHFERIPLRWSRYFFEAHRNPSLLVLITLDAREGTPLFVSTVHGCGCYLAVVPTDAVPRAQLPESWPAETQRVFGETLPAVLAHPLPGRRRVVVHLSADRHRVTGLQAGGRPAGPAMPLPLEPMDALRRLPSPDGDGTTRSLYYERGPLRGHVRGAWNAWEGLTLFALASLDPTVGMDKDLGDPEQTGTRFYTTLRFWKHEVSRLDRFGPLLRELGFRMGETAAAE